MPEYRIYVRPPRRNSTGGRPLSAIPMSKLSAGRVQFPVKLDGTRATYGRRRTKFLLESEISRDALKVSCSVQTRRSERALYQAVKSFQPCRFV